MSKEKKEDDYFISKRELGKLFDSKFPYALGSTNTHAGIGELI